MPTAPQHINQYKSNRKLIDNLVSEKSEHYDWIATISFYAAVHLVDKILAEKNIHPKTHVDREKYFNISELKRIRSLYTALEWDSRESRYECIKIVSKIAEDAIANLEDIEKKIPV